MTKYKEYLTVGVGYTLYFPTIKARNAFNKFTKDLYISMIAEKEYANHNALYCAIVKTLAKEWNTKIEIN